jgi:hypothetical protein
MGVDQRSVAGIGQDVIGTLDHAPDRQIEGGGEVVVALVVTRHRHDRARAVLHQHVVGDEHRDPLAVDRVDDGPAQRHAGLGALGVAALVGAFGQRAIHVVANRLLVLRSLGQAPDVRVLGGHDEEGRAEQRVRPGGEDGIVRSELGAGEGDFGALRASDPVALHRLDVLGPVDGVQVVQQPSA